MVRCDDRKSPVTMATATKETDSTEDIGARVKSKPIRPDTHMSMTKMAIVLSAKAQMANGDMPGTVMAIYAKSIDPMARV
jgi:hypothetical protein